MWKTVMPLPHTPTRSGTVVGAIVMILVVYAAGLHNCNLATNVFPMLRWQETRGRPPCEAVPKEALLRKHVHSRRARGGVVIPLLLLALAMSGASPWPAAGRAVPIPGNQRGVPPNARVLGPLPAGRPLRLIVGLSVRHPADLAAFLHARRAWPLSRPTLTPAQFAARFSPTPAEEEAVAAYLRAHGLHIVRTYPDRLLLDVAGTARQVEAAFGVSLVSYRDRHGDIRYANATPPRLPVPVAGLVGTVVGLRDDGTPRHARVARSWPRGRAPRPATWASPTARHAGCALACAARTERG